VNRKISSSISLDGAIFKLLDFPKENTRNIVEELS